MRIAYLDGFSGISGDMFLGALIDVGVPPELFTDTVSALGLQAKLQVYKVNRSGIEATKVDVVAGDEPDAPRRTGEQRVDEPGHKHTDPPIHHHHHHHQGHQHAPGRGLKEIRELIGKASIRSSAKDLAIGIFEKLGAAEAKIHNLPINEVHFHEVGAIDALVDIVCAAVGQEALGVDEFVASPLNVGGGTVDCVHGRFPVPAPATVELLAGAPVYSSGLEAELVTPTGAAIVAVLVKRFTAFPEMVIEKAGYGAGTRDFTGHANVLRMVVGESRPGLRAAGEEQIAVLETNLDDMNPQIFGYVMELLFEAGALEVFTTPVQMKKNRPGALLTVLARPQDAERLAEIVFRETTTLGIRRRPETRQVLARSWKTVSTRFGDVRVKVASWNGTVTGCAPEYEDCRRIAAHHRVPLKRVIEEAAEECLKLESALGGAKSRAPE